MATHDPMDLDVRSQAFYKDFYHFHKNSCDAWYIKDANHEIVDCSLTFQDTYQFFESEEALAFRDDLELALLKHEKDCLEKEIVVTLLVNRYLFDLNGCSTFTLQINPFLGLGNLCTLTKVIKLSNYMSQDFFIDLLIQPNDIKQHYIIQDLEGINPKDILTAREWEIIWLIIVGKSNRWISEFINCSRQTIERTINRAYSKLQLFNRTSLIANAMFYRWVDFTPESLFSNSQVILI